jgi:hypothetical protein
MTFWQYFGLTLMLAAFVITMLILIYDALRAWYWEIPTISSQIWTKLASWRSGNGFFPWAAALLPLGVALQAIGLLIHLLSPK